MFKKMLISLLFFVSPYVMASGSANSCVVFLEVDQWKLIRDDFPAIFERENDPAEWTQVDGTLYTELLMKKVGEELLELSNAATPTEQAEEMADLLEVILAVEKHKGLDPELESLLNVVSVMQNSLGLESEVVEQVRLKKRSKKGGFERGIVMKLKP